MLHLIQKLKMVVFSALNVIFATTSENEKVTHFDVLDGFRGILAFSVALQHTTGFLKMQGEYLICEGLGDKFGVPSPVSRILMKF